MILIVSTDQIDLFSVFLICIMKFHLNYKPSLSTQKITHNERLLMIGSCFSEHIGDRLNELKFNLFSNPFGIVFNPKSIELMLLRSIRKDYFTESTIFEKDSQYFCFEAHSVFTEDNAAQLINKLNETIDHCHSILISLDYLIITFGSAFAYKHNDTQSIVANCHKLPQAVFEKVLLEQDGIASDYKRLMDELKTVNSNIKIIFTVSPVKHLREGVEENSLSKAILIQTVHKLVKQFENCFYFPAYELVNDDLRDYRFYEPDMAHPNGQAIDYVWQRFSEVYFSNDTLLLNDKLKQLNQAMKHRIFHERSESSIKFKNDFFRKCKELQEEFPFLNLSKELNYFNTL